MPVETVKKVLPWKPGVPAWIMAVEGAVIAAMGVYITNQPGIATRALLIALGALLLFHGVPRLSRYYSGPAEAREEAERVYGLYGTVAGSAAILLSVFVGEGSLTWVAVLLGAALGIAGVLELIERLRIEASQRRPGYLIMPLVLIAAGVALILVRAIPGLDAVVIGQILALLGFSLLAIGLVRVYGGYQRRGALAEAEAKREQLVKEIAEAEKRAGVKPSAPPSEPVPAPAPVGAAAGVPPSAVSPVVAPPGDEPEDPAVKAALEP